ncbi:YveK family protein [Mycobacterium parmense]|uniref:YveK family protein n=1 Tax=Mycobacterium parmense TaxID=185642 RepID=UPI0013747F41|nr:hypothetical protein [Mycobacterium parmense]MCV7352094.1 hypothetical protein [Mycobacterium parmense]
MPQALGLSTSEWVQTRLGGPAGTSIPMPPTAVEKSPEQSAAESEPEAEEQTRRPSLAHKFLRRLKKSPPATTPAQSRRRGEAERLRLRRAPVYWPVIPFFTVMGLFAGFVWAAANPPVYESQAAAFVALTALPADNPNVHDPFGGSQFALQRVASYAALATEPQLIQAAIHDVNRGDPAKAAENIKVVTSGGVMLWVTVDDRDPQTAANLANAVMGNLVHEVAVLEGAGGQHAPVQLVPVQPALVPNEAQGTPAVIDLVVGLVVGLALGGAVFYFIRWRRGDSGSENSANDARPGGRPKAGSDRHDAGVVVLRVGDGRDFSRRVGR